MNSQHWLRLCLHRPFVVLVLLALITGFILIVLQFIANCSDNGAQYIHPLLQDRRIDKMNSRIDLRDETISSLILRIEDLKRIKSSVSNELQLLQRDKMKILKDKANLLQKNERILSQINKNKAQLKQIELDIVANRKQKADRACDDASIAPIVFNPMSSVDIIDYSIYTDHNHENTTKTDHAPQLPYTVPYELDLSLCRLTNEFRFNLTGHLGLSTDPFTDGQAGYMDDFFEQSIQLHRLFTNTSQNVCLTVILFKYYDSNLIQGTRNNLVINLSSQTIKNETHYEIMRRSMVASSSFARGTYRNRIDLVIPSIIQPEKNYDSVICSIPLKSPLDRKYFASYFGDSAPKQSSSTTDQSDYELTDTDRILQTIHRSSIDDMFLFIYNCGPNTNQQCYSEREKMIELSIFLIVIPSEHFDSDRNTNDLIYLALSRGTIPVIVGKERVRLPFDEVIDWRRATILIPTARLPEIHFILRSLSPADLYSLKYHGRRIFENHLATSKQIFDSIISLISLERLNYPPPPIESVKTDTYYPSHELKIDTNCTLTACQDANQSDSMISLLSSETFGPREKPFASPVYRRNLSFALVNSYDLWNHPLHSPYHLMPSNPDDPIPPSEFKFLSRNQGYRPIGDGQGGSGVEFSQALGGDYPNEQFTIVILTYERITLLMKTLERLKGLAYLNKILVVWNGINQKPQESLLWPDVGVPIVLVKVEKNSLNNRFLPYDAIETDAIFSMDDDSPLRPDEIVFAFRVWRESRDRIVGFPGRFHAWDSGQNSWIYNSNHSCELSMVLTGGAFYHKYYTYVYSQLMPESIRSIVDKFMNCEDIAMNFLVAHLTRKPPIKVTSRWTFHCASCATSLSEDDTHFMERHECLNIFSSIYGYMPLLNTQHRSDSILFKTRLPKDKQKCFKFV